MEKVQQFIDEWKTDPHGVKPVFISLYKEILRYDDARIAFHDRPGISYSLRGIHKNQKSRSLFVMLDVIDESPEDRWLSVCFYGDSIEDPEEFGDLIPEGLLGEDGYCFDITPLEIHMEGYVKQRIREAYEKAALTIAD